MKKRYSCFFVKTYIVISLLLISINGFTQPANLFANFGVTWNDYTLSDRNSTLGITVQSLNAGTGACLFNTAAGNYDPKWCGSTSDYNRILNTKLDGAAFYYSTGGWDHDLAFPIQANYYYTFIISKSSSTNNDMSIIETSFNPVTITNVTQSPVTVNPTQPVNVTVTVSGPLGSGEHVFVRYSDNSWVTSSFFEITSFVSNQGTVTIPGKTVGTVVSYYAFSTNQATPDGATVDYFTININNNSNLNYSYTVTTPAPAATISALPALTETNLNGSTITLALSDTKFIDGILIPANFTLFNAPAGTSINNITYVDSVYANIDLAFNGTDFDADSTHVYISICSCETNAGMILNSNDLTITAVIESINTIDWCNVQSPSGGTISEGGSFNVYAQVLVNGVTNLAGQGAGINASIGYSTINSNPDTWTNWIPAMYNIDVGNNDEYIANIGTPLTTGTYYYASRFQINSGAYFYGGFSGGFWDGTNNISGMLNIVPAEVDWCNLQWPASDTIQVGWVYNVYAQVYEPGITDAVGQGTGITAWIGYNNADTDPSTWTNWIAASYNIDAGNNDEYMEDIGTGLTAGVYYYTSRFQLNNGVYKYGGFNASGGGYWDGTTNISGKLLVELGTGIDESSNHSIVIWPNPAYGQINIKVDSDIKCSIINNFGQEVISFITNNNNQQTIDLRALPKGVYILRIIKDNEASSKQLIIQ